MKGKSRGRIAPGIILGSFICAIAVFFALLYTEKRAMAAGEYETVVVANENILRGESFDESNIDKFFSKLQVPKNLVPEGAVRSIDDLLGKKSDCALYGRTIITEKMFTSENDIKGTMKEPVLACFKAEDLYQAVGGILRSGDKIHMYMVDESGIVKLKWSDVTIVNAFDNAGNEVTLASADKSIRFNVYMEKADVEEFYHLLDSKRVRIVKVCN